MVQRSGKRSGNWRAFQPWSADLFESTYLNEPPTSQNGTNSGAGSSGRKTEEARQIYEALEARELPCAFLYDELGCFLFEEITKCNEYYLTRVEMDLLERATPTLAPMLQGTDIVELGSGSCRKISILLNALDKHSLNSTRYVPIDVSKNSIEEAKRLLHLEYPSIEVHGIASDFLSGLKKIPGSDRRVFCFFGSTLGNLSARERRTLFNTLSTLMYRDSKLLLGVDIVKDRRIIEAAYNDAGGLTAAFNLNVLRVVNRQAGTNFDLADFEHVATYNEISQTMTMYLHARHETKVHSPFFRVNLHFCPGDRIVTERSRKFQTSHISTELMPHKLRIEKAWIDKCEWYALLLIGKN